MRQMRGPHRILVIRHTGRMQDVSSVTSISTHLRSIYAKLQVRDRSSAVQRARELRLLAAGRTR